jgi:UPF0755 protein
MPRSRRTRNATLALAGVLVAFPVFYIGFLSPPGDFSLMSVVTIEEGMTLEEAGQSLKGLHVIRSEFWFRVAVILGGGEHSLRAGDYFFKEPIGVFSIARMMVTGDYGLDPIRVTIPEGASNVDIADRLAEALPTFDRVYFLEYAEGKEGYLFPDTYYFLPTDSEEKIADTMEETFRSKMELYRNDLRISEYSLQEIITMASLIEREANTEEVRRIISGILWKRLEIGMPLQVDVTFDYINGKNSFELTSADLEIDSPYNTYRYAGLPPTPIANPSLESIHAALHPVESDYLYFLADHEGIVYYSETFEEHREKKLRYLN